MKKSLLIIILLLATPVSGSAETPLKGYWFECEFAKRTTPPHDDCAMLDDDGVLFDENRVTMVKVRNSTETDACHKHRAGQCFRADTEAVKISHGFGGRIIASSPDGLTVRAFGCRQDFSLTPRGAYFEIRANNENCWWTRPLMRKGAKYVRPYEGAVTE